MVTVSGRLLDFVEDPSSVAEVQVRAKTVAPHGDGLMTDHPVTVDFDPATGTVSFDAAAGTIGVLSWVTLGRSHASESLPLVVPDKATATLRECAEAAMLADKGTITELQRLALDVAGQVSAVEQLATDLPATIDAELDTRVPPAVSAEITAQIDAGLPGKADTTYVDAQDTALGKRITDSLPWRGVLPDGTDINAVRTAGIYTVASTASAATMLNWPTTKLGILKVWTNEGTNATIQEITAYVSTSSPTEQYSRATLSAASTGWSPWDNELWSKRRINGTADARTNIETFRTAGAWVVSSSTYVDGLPVNVPGFLEVFSYTDTGMTLQRYTARISGSETSVFHRTTLTVSGFGGVPWQKIGGGGSTDPVPAPGSDWVKGLANGTSEAPRNIDTFRDAGAWAVSSASTVTGLPVNSVGVLENFAFSSTGVSLQRYTARLSPTEVGVYQRMSLLVAGYEGVPWDEVGGASSGPDPAQPGVVADTSTAVSDHAARVEYARSRRGGGIGTGGKPVVMLRFDHWLVAFRDKVLPILRKYSLPATLNMNYDNLTLEQNGAGTITWADVQDWNQRYGIEIANHGSTHTNPTDAAGIYHEIVDGRRNLEAAMPRVAVETWHEHGSAYLTASDIDGDIGLNLGREPKNFFESYAGRLVLAEHAVIEGKSGGFFVNLSGEPQIGQSHFSADRDTAQSVINQVTTAQTLGRGMTLYTHPGSMNNVLVGGKNWPADYREDGTVVVTNPTDSTTQTFATEDELRTWADTNGHIVFMPFKDFDVFCAHLAAERDAGRLMVMTAAGGSFANIKSDYRENLLVKPGFTDGYSSWWSGMSGWTVTNPGPEVTLTSTSGAGQMNQAMLLHSRFGWAMGAAHELLVRASATTDTTLTLRAEQMGNPTNWNVGEIFTVPGDGVARDYRLNISLPRDPSITQVRWFMGGPSMTIHGAPLLAAI